MTRLSYVTRSFTACVNVNHCIKLLIHSHHDLQMWVVRLPYKLKSAEALRQMSWLSYIMGSEAVPMICEAVIKPSALEPSRCFRISTPDSRRTTSQDLKQERCNYAIFA
jgi:hypothetical protein